MQFYTLLYSCLLYTSSGKDDAAGSAVSTLMEAQISGYDVAESNATMGLSLLDTAEGVLDIVSDYLQRISCLLYTSQENMTRKAFLS